MSLIHQHEVAKVVPVGPGLFLAPGGLCSHVEDRKSLGLIVAVELASDAGTVTVLWSVPPYGSSPEDIAYFQKKLFAALKIPQEMLRGVADQAHQAKVALDCFNKSLRDAR